MLIDSDNYRPSMTRFLNQFSKKSRSFTPESLPYFQELFELFCNKVIEINPKMFISKSGKFSITVFESIFVALCSDALKSKSLDIKSTNNETIELLKSNPEFIKASQDNTAGKSNVDLRLNIAKVIIG